MQICKVYNYKGKPVLITGGQYSVNGRVSNLWHFRRIKKDGSLGTKGADYSYAFTACKDKYEIRVVKIGVESSGQ